MRRCVGECRMLKITVGDDKVLLATAPSLVTVRLSNTIRYEKPHVRLTFGCALRIDADC